MLERPDLLKELVVKHGAKDTTARQAALAELDAMESRPSQYSPGNEIPEKSWAYRFVKKFWFNDFGVYETKWENQKPIVPLEPPEPKLHQLEVVK